MCNNTKEEDIVEKWGLPLKELYTLALKFFKGKSILFMKKKTFNNLVGYSLFYPRFNSLYYNVFEYL